MKNYYFRFWANDYAVQLTMRRQRNLHYFKWIQSKFREKEKIFVACLRSQEKLLIRKFYVLKFLGLAVQQRQRNPTEKRASPCTCRVISVLLVKTHWLNFLTFQKPPLTVNLTDISFLVMSFNSPSASVDNTLLLDLQNSSYPRKAEFNNCFIIPAK